MRTRDKKMIHYGISDKRSRELIAYCRNVGKQEAIKTAASQANPAISDLLYENLVSGRGYDKLSGRHYMPYSRNDFYGYRRLALSCLNELLKEKAAEAIVQ